MRILKKIDGQIRSVVIRDSRIEIELDSGKVNNYYLSTIPPELDISLAKFFILVKNKELDAQDRKIKLGTDVYITDPKQGTKRAILGVVKDMMELYQELETLNGPS